MGMTSKLIMSGIDPDLDVVGGEKQNINFDKNNSTLSLNSKFIPIESINSVLNLELVNTNLSGYRITHDTSLTDNEGKLYISYFQNGSSENIPLLKLDKNFISFEVDTSFKEGLSIPVSLIGDVSGSGNTAEPIETKFNLTLDQIVISNNLNLEGFKITNLGLPESETDGTSKIYVDTKNLEITNYINQKSISDFLAAIGNIDLNNNLITNLADGVNAHDAINLQQLNNAINNIQPTTINLSGAITGNGTNNIDTVLSPFQTMDSNFLNFNWSDNSGISVGPPSIGNKIANENFSQFSFNVTDTFFQSHGGDYHNCQFMLDPLPYNKLLGYIFAINYNSLVNLKSKNDIPFAISIYNYTDNYNLYSVDLTARLNLNNSPIINVASPTNDNDATNKSYVDSLITAQLSALSNLSTSGIMARTGTNTFVTRSISVGSGLGISNSDGVSGNPTLSLSNQLQNLHNLNTLGFISLATTGSGTSTFVNRSLAAGTGINITNGNGVSGNPTINLGTVPINTLSNYPSDNSLFLNGAGSWTIPQLADITVSANYNLSINNTNTTSTFTDFMFRKNGTNAASFGFNNSTNEGYAWSYSGSSFKIGTNNTKRIDIGVDGTIDCLTNDIITTGTINAKTGTLRANNIGTFDSVALVSEKQINMSNNNIINVATPINNNDAANKLYVDTQSNSIATLIQGSDTTGRRLIAFVHNVTTTISSGTLQSISLPTAYRNSANVILSLTVLNAVDADNMRAAYGSYSTTKSLSYGMDTTGRYVKFKCTSANIEAGSIVTALILGVV